MAHLDELTKIFPQIIALPELSERLKLTYRTHLLIKQFHKGDKVMEELRPQFLLVSTSQQNV